MKTYIFAALSTLGLLSTQVRAAECIYKEVPAMKKVYVIPMYRANANYFYDYKAPEAFVLVNWGFDRDKTKECFETGKLKFPSYSMAIPTLRMDDLLVRAMGSDVTTPLNVFQEVGHWSGLADTIKVDMRTQYTIEEAIKKNVPVIEILGDLRYRYTEVERKIVGNLDCLPKDEEAGILTLSTRFIEIRSFLEDRNSESNEKIDITEVRNDFLNSCVVFQNVDANSLQEFDKNQRMNSRTIKGNLYFQGNVEKETTGKMPTITDQTITIFES